MDIYQEINWYGMPKIPADIHDHSINFIMLLSKEAHYSNIVLYPIPLLSLTQFLANVCYCALTVEPNSKHCNCKAYR